MSYGAVKWINRIGEEAYQPRLSNGEALWVDDLSFDEWAEEPPTPLFSPELLKSRDKAERVAKREELRRARGDWRRAEE